MAGMVETFGVDLSGLVLDMTNFATWIDSANVRAPIAQRGHAKQKRSDLRICGLGLVVSTDGGVPLVSHRLPGEPPRCHPVRNVVNELLVRFGALCPTAKASASPWSTTPARTPGTTTRLVDRDAACTLSPRCPPRIIPSSSPSAKNRYKVVDKRGLPGPHAPSRRPRSSSAVSAVSSCSSLRWTARQAVAGASTRPSPRCAASSPSSNHASAGATTRKIRGASRGRDSCDDLAPRWVSRVVSATPRRRKPGELRLEFHTDGKARAVLEDELFGKRILFTDNDDPSRPARQPSSPTTDPSEWSRPTSAR